MNRNKLPKVRTNPINSDKPTDIIKVNTLLILPPKVAAPTKPSNPVIIVIKLNEKTRISDIL